MPPVNPKCNTLLKTGQTPCNDSRHGNIALGYPSASHQTIPIQQYSDWVCSSNEVCPKAHENWLHIKERKISLQSHNDNPPKPGINKSVAPSEVAIEAAQSLNTLAKKHHASLFKEGDITINDPEFKRPPSKPQTLSLAIKIFMNSFKNLYLNKQRGPDVDRSDRVEKINKYCFALSTAAIFTALAVTTTLLTIKLGMVLFNPALPRQVLIWRTETLGYLFAPVCMLAMTVITVEAFIAMVLANVITSTVAASVDTYEQLTKKEQYKTPEERFIEKYQRMEHLLQRLKNQRGRQTFKYNGIKSLLEWIDIAIEQLALHKFDCKTDVVGNAIIDIEAWLDRAKKQKQLIDNTMEMTEMPTPEPEANMDNRYHWLAV